MRAVNAQGHREGRARRGSPRIRAALLGLGLGSLSLLSPPNFRTLDSEAGSGAWRLRFEATEFAAGDVIFRRGRSLVSRVVLAADGGSEYSHVGLVSMVDGKVWVLHAVPPEEPEQQGGVVAEPLSAFLEPDKAAAAGLYRSRDAGAALAAERAAWRFVRARIPFDSSFDLSTPGELYCTEMVWRAYLEGGIDLAPPVPGPREKYLLPSRLLRSPHLRKIQELTEEVSLP
jgi:Permuted papain-like amidase enzyme, YaeF/YiiX, C92 family